MIIDTLEEIVFTSDHDGMACSTNRIRKYDAAQLYSDLGNWLHRKADMALVLGGPRHGALVSCPKPAPDMIEFASLLPASIAPYKEGAPIEANFGHHVYRLTRSEYLNNLPYLVYEYEDLDVDNPYARAERLENETREAEKEFNYIKPQHDKALAKLEKLVNKRLDITEKHGI